MNERIKELAEQAVREVDNVDLDSPLQEELAKMYIPDCFSEKFAELIVRECCQALWTDACHMSDLAVEEFNSNSRKIKRHFGVES